MMLNSKMHEHYVRGQNDRQHNLAPLRYYSRIMLSEYNNPYIYNEN